MEHDRLQLDKLLPVIQRRLSQATDALAGCLHIKDVVIEWFVSRSFLFAPVSERFVVNYSMLCFR